jgi:hypothetical protein
MTTPNIPFCYRKDGEEFVFKGFSCFVVSLPSMGDGIILNENWYQLRIRADQGSFSLVEFGQALRRDAKKI